LFLLLKGGGDHIKIKVSTPPTATATATTTFLSLFFFLKTTRFLTIGLS